jgi:hypothetical protein
MTEVILANRRNDIKKNAMEILDLCSENEFLRKEVEHYKEYEKRYRDLIDNIKHSKEMSVNLFRNE